MPIFFKKKKKIPQYIPKSRPSTGQLFWITDGIIQLFLSLPSTVCGEGITIVITV